MANDESHDDIMPASKMGFGCMRLPLLDANDPKSIDIEQFKQMIDVFMGAGNTYFDTAFVYHEGESEVALNKALVSRYPRESFTLASKCLAWSLPDAQAAKNCLDVSLERLGTDYIDYYLLHNLGGKRTKVFEEYGLWEYFGEQKRQGKIRYLGFSLHDDAECLERILTAHPEADFVQLQVNYLDWVEPSNNAKDLMDVAARHGKPVIIMEPARGGMLCRLPESVAAILDASDAHLTQAQWAYRFCWNLPNVLSVLSGMSTIEQARENCASYAANAPLSSEERALLDEAVGTLRSMIKVPCTACNYCVKACPSNVKIPQIMSILNLEAMTGGHDFAKGLYSWQAAEGRASSCIKCGTCEGICPQSIKIIDELEEAVEKYE